jgi:hypothetical protein
MRSFIHAAALMLALTGWAAAEERQEFQPDQALIAKIEAKFAPIMAAGMKDIGDHDVKALAPLDQYARFYAGEIDKGERVVVGAVWYGRDHPAGIRIVTMKELPTASGGGCSVIMLWYHVDSGKIESVCNFPM